MNVAIKYPRLNFCKSESKSSCGKRPGCEWQGKQKCQQTGLVRATKKNETQFETVKGAFVVETLVHVILACIDSVTAPVENIVPKPLFMARVQPRYRTRRLAREAREKFGIQRNSIIIGMEALHKDGWGVIDEGNAREIFSFLLQCAGLLIRANQNKMRFTHRDFHPGNMMCKKNTKSTVNVVKGLTLRTKYVWKLIDFGMSCMNNFMPPQEQTAYYNTYSDMCSSDDNSYYDMRLMLHTMDWHRDDFPDKVKAFLEPYRSRFEDKHWHEGYVGGGTLTPKASDADRFAPANIIRAVVTFCEKNGVNLVAKNNNSVVAPKKKRRRRATTPPRRRRKKPTAKKKIAKKQKCKRKPSPCKGKKKRKGALTPCGRRRCK